MLKINKILWEISWPSFEKTNKSENVILQHRWEGKWETRCCEQRIRVRVSLTFLLLTSSSSHSSSQVPSQGFTHSKEMSDKKCISKFFSDFGKGVFWKIGISLVDLTSYFSSSLTTQEKNDRSIIMAEFPDDNEEHFVGKRKVTKLAFDKLSIRCFESRGCLPSILCSPCKRSIRWMQLHCIYL